MLTILLPTYNSAHRLEACLSSLERQTSKHFRVLVSDNHSSDNTLEVAESFRKKINDLTIISQGLNIGALGNFALLLESCKTKHFMFLDSEDELSEDYVRNYYQSIGEDNLESSIYIPKFFELGRNLSKRRLLISDRLINFPGRYAFLSALNSNSFEGIGHLFYSVFSGSRARTLFKRVLGTEYSGSLDISAAWFFLYMFDSIKFFDGELMHYSIHYSVNETRHALNNQFISEQYAHLDYQTATTALRQFLDLCKPDLSEQDFIALKDSLERFFAAKYSFIQSYQQVRGCLGLPPFLS